MKAPEYPDPFKTATAQGTMNLQTAIGQYLMNATNQYCPWGSIQYAQDGVKKFFDTLQNKWVEIPNYVASTVLSPMQQKLFDLQEQLGLKFGNFANSQVDKLSKLMSTPFSYGGPDLETDLKLKKLQTRFGPQNYGRQKEKVVEAIMSRMQPEMDAARAAEMDRLANQGLQLGGKEYAEASRLLGQNENDMRMQAYLAGGSEQSRLANLALQKFNAQNAAISGNNQAALQRFGAVNAARLNDFMKAIKERGLPLEEVAMLMGGAGPSNPNWINTPQVGVNGVDYAGLVNAKFQNDSANYQAGLGGLFGLGGMLMKGLFGLSDERAKKNIKKVGKLDDGTKIYSYQYKEKFGGPKGLFHLGVMAQEVEKKHPRAVRKDPSSGMKMVNYHELAERVGA